MLSPQVFFQLARDKGFYDGFEINEAGVVAMTIDQRLSKMALMSSELSEAVEAAYLYGDKDPEAGEGEKPEGFVVEMADYAIRALDYIGSQAGEFVRSPDDDLWLTRNSTSTEPTAQELICETLFRLGMVTENVRKGRFDEALLNLKSSVWFLLSAMPNLEGAIEKKHAYNQSRPYKHNKLA